GGHSELERAARLDRDLLAARLDGGVRAAAAARARVASGAAGGGQEADDRDGHPDDAAAADELAPADVAGAVLVDQVVLEFTAPRTDRVDLPLRVLAAHALLLLRPRVRSSVHVVLLMD